MTTLKIKSTLFFIVFTVLVVITFAGTIHRARNPHLTETQILFDILKLKVFGGNRGQDRYDTESEDKRFKVKQFLQ